MAPLLRAFDLAEEPPLRVARQDGGNLLHLVGHHAALDGLGLLAVVRQLLDLPAPAPSASALEPRPVAAAGQISARSAFDRLRRPADRIGRSRELPRHETIVAREPHLSGPRLTARLAEAAVAAVEHRDGRLHRVGISLGVGGQQRIGNTASYRRVDLDRSAGAETVAEAVDRALASTAIPTELRRPSPLLRLLSPVIDRLSDTFLISNLGRHHLPDVERIEFYPVARGRSAVAFGAVGLDGGPSTLTIRARDLSQGDAERLLDDTVARLAAGDGGS